MAVLRQIGAALSAIHAWLDRARREQGMRDSSPEAIAAARAVREMQDAIAKLTQEKRGS